MKIYIKNMVSKRCLLVVTAVFRSLSIQTISIEPGEAETASPLDDQTKHLLRTALEKSGFVMIEEKKQLLVERIKILIVELVNKNEDHRLKMSVYLSGKLPYHYHYLSGLFSKAEGITIEKYLIVLKIEKAKELLSYGEMTVCEIADKLHYSSAAYLNIQFKKITGFTPVEYKRKKRLKRISLDQVNPHFSFPTI